VDAATEEDGRSELASLRVEFMAEALAGDELSARRARLGVRRAERVGETPGDIAETIVELARGGTVVARALVGRR
jgi:hypothetical protein